MKDNKGSKEYYEKRAKRVDTLTVTYLSREVVGSFYRQRSEKTIELLQEVISDLKLKKIQDIGCGAGWCLIAIVTKRAHTIGQYKEIDSQ